MESTREMQDWELSSLSGPMMISWDITNKCNFNCKHCLNRSNDCSTHDFDDELNDSEIDDIISQIIDIKPYSLCICGGEPTLSPKIFDIIKRISAIGCQVNMVSNGYFIDENYAKKLEAAGLYFIQISLDSIYSDMHDEFREKKGAYKNALQAISFLKNTKIRIATAMTPTSFNVEQLTKYVEFVQNLGCNYVRMMPLLPMGRGLDSFNTLEPSEEQYLRLVIEIEKLKIKYPNFNAEWGDPLEHIYLAQHKPRIQPIIMEIRANGDLGVSVYLPISVGNIRRHSLQEYWNGGYNQIWGNEDVLNLAKELKTIEDFKKLSLQTWSSKRKTIDILEV